MLSISRSEMKTEKSLFLANEQQVNATVCKYLALVFVFFPLMLLLDAAGIFKFSGHVQLLLVCLGSFCTVSPFVLSRFIHNQSVIKYYILVCVIVLTSTLGTEYYVGVYMTFMVAPIMSCMYFDKKLTSKTIVMAYVGYLISYYFRSVETRNLLYPGESVWDTYIPLAAGFTIEFIICFIFLYRLAERAQFFLIEQRKFIGEIEKREAKLSMVLDSSRDIFFEYDIAEDVYSSNGSIRDWQRNEIRIEDFLAYAEGIDWECSDFLDMLYRFIALKEGEETFHSGRADFRFQDHEKKLGGWVYYEVNVLRDATGKPATILGKITDVTEERLEELKAEEAQRFDALTGMYYYNSLRKIIRETENGQEKRVHQIMIIQLKNYHEIAGCYGEMYRDFVVMNVAEVIREAISGTGAMACRLSASVFMVYVQDSESVNARGIRQKLNVGLGEVYVGEKSVDTLEYDFGYYLGEEQIDDLFTIALGYVDEDSRREEMPERGPDQRIVTLSGAQTFQEISPGKRMEKSRQFFENITSLIEGAKDRESAIQIAMDRMGKFYQLDGIRIYPVRRGRQAEKALFHWAVSPGVRRECDMYSLNPQVRDIFVEKFGRSRIVDNTMGVFQDFFRQFGENPLLISGYSSLICPLVSEDVCKAVIIYDMSVTDFVWSDEWKEELLKMGKLLGSSLLLLLDSNYLQDKDSLLSQMSYEIRMPMNAIFEMTDTARMELDSREHVERCLDMIDASSWDMFHVVNHILDLSKIELASWRPVNEIFSLEDVLARVENQAVERSRNSDVNLQFERQFQKNLLRGDSAKLFRVLNYLVDNAVRYTDRGGKIYVLVQEISQDNYLCDMYFQITDEGVSISQDEMEQMSELLEKGRHWNIDRESRIGLDLVIAYRYVEMMGGHLAISGGANGGMKFSFRLAMGVPARENMIEYLSRQQERNDDTIDLTGKTILLAEDDGMNAEIVKRLLEKHGAEVEIAGNGKQCVDMFQSGRDGKYSLILMDILMPILNGHEAAREIRSMEGRKDARTIPIIALSATAFEADKKESLAAGMNAHLVKPIHVEEVMREIEKHL